MKLSFRFPILAIAILTASPNAMAFRISDHRWITRQAIAELDSCMPALVSPGDAEKIERADIDQDLNLVAKWARYSHYYNPTKQLKMRRRDSGYRVAGLESEIRKLSCDRDGAADALYALGAAIHHIQDAASPPHVVPVTHGFLDGFENYRARPAVPAAPVCEAPDQEGPSAILKRTAIRTLEAVTGGKLNAARDGKALSIGWSEFWRPSADSSFGAYGELGNAFGRPAAYAHGTKYEIGSGVYASFKDDRMRAAIDATKAALSWYYVTLPKSCAGR